MLLDRWRARRALATRTPPTSVDEPADPRLRTAVEGLRVPLGCPESLGDPHWHFRWDGALQLVGLDVRERSVADLRQRLLRLVHECDLRHMPRLRRRVVAVLLCRPRGGEGLDGWFLRLQNDAGTGHPADWRAARRRIAIVALDADAGDPPRHRLFGGDRVVQRAVEAWADARTGIGSARTVAGTG